MGFLALQEAMGFAGWKAEAKLLEEEYGGTVLVNAVEHLLLLVAVLVVVNAVEHLLLLLTVFVLTPYGVGWYCQVDFGVWQLSRC